MCELLGISCNIKIRPVPYFELFRKRGREFPDGSGCFHGWGIALYPGGRKSVQVIKEAVPAKASRLAKFLSSYQRLRSRIFVVHIRRASRGSVAYRNSHPFCREVLGKEYVFAHNGTIRNSRRLSLGRFMPVGTTDSEHLFCHILNFIEHKGIYSWTEEDLVEFWKLLVSINLMSTKNKSKSNKVNILLSDGEILISYSDFYGNGALHKLTIHSYEESDGGNIPAGDDESVNGMPTRSTVIVATNPLDDDPGWVAMDPGGLRAFRNGVLVSRVGPANQCMSPPKILG